MSSAAWGQWLWDNRDTLSAGVTKLYRWLFPDRSSGTVPEKPGVLILGPGGVGKTTLGRILSGKVDLLFGLPTNYDESLDIERYALKDAPGVEILVPPGQAHRREATWNEQLTRLAAGEYRGMILVLSYGYHNHELGTLTSYKDHRLYKGNKEDFLRSFLQDRRQEELKVLRTLAPRVTPPAGGKFWLLTLVTKQDLWWEDRAAAERFYSETEYAAEITTIQNRHGGQLFRHELALASLVISNFETGKGEVLWQNASGYDQKHHARSVGDLLGKLDGLRRWEEGQ